MNILVVYAHHEPKSLVASLKNVAISTMHASGHKVVETDLYANGFTPVANKYDFSTLTGKHFNYMLEQKHASEHDLSFAPDVVGEIQRLQEADMVIFYFPVWWFAEPAILKGWFDRVLAMGIAWDGGKIYENGMLRGKKAMVVAVAGGPEEYYQPLGKHKATLKQILHPLHHGTLAFCGMDVLEPFLVYSSMNKTKDEYSSLLERHKQTIDQVLTRPRYLSKY
jgi:NAD(P)H dehydrogenase (quinone)